MQNTTNYNFNLPEGTDLWNYLTQTNPNFTALDTILKSVSDATVTTATEVTSGTAHAVTRTLPDANVIRFTATGVWTLGDTMTIDGTPVTVVKPNGTSLQTGDYIIGAEVLGVLRATQFTVYVGGASAVDAADVTFDNDNTHAWLTGTDVEDAIKETATEVDAINSKLTWKLKGTLTNYTDTLDVSSAKEVCLVAKYTNQRASVYVPINSFDGYFLYWGFEGTYIQAQLNLDKSVRFGSYNNGSEQIGNGAILDVYWR